MMSRRTYLMDNGGVNSAATWQSINSTAARSRKISCLKTSFNKTWHANCSVRAVSKILDWLVL
jgi:hypothetical protein